MVQKFATLQDAIALATFAHRNQQDKAGLPYIDHPLRVMSAVQAMGGRPYVQIAAVLHDVTEDTRFTIQMLRDLGFSEAAVNLVALLDRDYSEDLYFADGPEDGSRPDSKSLIDNFYYKGIRENPDALMIKNADITDNLLPWRQSYLSDETQVRLAKKYRDARVALGLIAE